MDRRVIVGMNGRCDLNGRTCIIIGASHMADDRWCVKLADTGEEPLHIKQMHLWTEDAYAAHEVAELARKRAAKVEAIDRVVKRAAKRCIDNVLMQAARPLSARQMDELDAEFRRREWLEWLAIYMEWIDDGRPSTVDWKGGVLLEQNYFHESDFDGGTDEDGAPWGPHPFYTGTKPAWVHWRIVRHLLLLRLRALKIYWYWLEQAELTARRHTEPDQEGIAFMQVA